MTPDGSARAPQILTALWESASPGPFDEIVDVRSPGEFADDHLPGAVNLPVLSDDERAEVGTIHRREGSFAAARIGAAYISMNIGTHLAGHFSTKGKDFKPLIYCWRGGQRSASIALVLARIGWRTTLLAGGYKTYRAHVLCGLDTAPPRFEYRVVTGATGTGKTRLLNAMAARGAQVLDLEALARHRGSVLGGSGPQPSQKRFDSLLLAAFDRFDPQAPVWVEAESNRIGDVYLPAALWAAMRSAGGIEIRMPIDERVRHLVEAYANLFADPVDLKEKLTRLTPKYGARQIAEWCLSVDACEWNQLAVSLLTIHYDAAYAASTERYFPCVTEAVDLPDATAEAVGALVEKLARHFRTLEASTAVIEP